MILFSTSCVEEENNEYFENTKFYKAQEKM